MLRHRTRLAAWLTLATLLLLPASALAMRAGNLGESMKLSEGDIPVSLQLSGGYLWGESGEYVYDEESGRKISELQWELRNIYMVGGTLSAAPADWLLVSLGGWGAVNSHSGRMTDYDWMDEDNGEWTDRSVGRTRLDHGWMFDANAMFPIELHDNFSIAPLVGFKHDNWKWHDEDMNYIYSDDGWRNDVGSATGTAIIYEQWFYTPYAGLSVGAQYEGFSLGAYFRGTPFAWAKDKDEHLNRSITYDGDFHSIRYVGVGVEASYAFTEHVSVGLAYDYQEYLLRKGDMEYADASDGDTGRSRNGSGLSHYSNMVTLSLRYAF